MLARHRRRVHRAGQSGFGSNFLLVSGPYVLSPLVLNPTSSCCLSRQNCHELEKMDLEECILVRQRIYLCVVQAVDCMRNTTFFSGIFFLLLLNFFVHCTVFTVFVVLAVVAITEKCFFLFSNRPSHLLVPIKTNNTITYNQYALVFCLLLYFCCFFLAFRLFF